MKKTIIILSVIIILFAAFYNGLTVKRYVIRSEKITESVRLALLTDLHSCFYGKEQKKLLEKIHAQSPDIVLLSGDIADDKMPHAGTIALLEGIAGKYPCYYVTGNHEFWSNEVDRIKDMFKKYNVKVLEGNNDTITIRNQKINICGVDDPDVGMDIFEVQLKTAFASTDDEAYTVFMSHRPELVNLYKSLNCDLIVSGHAHGGQWRIPFILKGFFSPNQGFFPKYTSGIYDIGEIKMLVSRGMSRESSRIPRIFNPPELVIIDIMPF